MVGLESKLGRGPGPLDRGEISRSCLIPEVVQIRRVFFWGTQLGTLIRESPSTTVQIGLLSSIVVRTERWKGKENGSGCLSLLAK